MKRPINWLSLVISLSACARLALAVQCAAAAPHAPSPAEQAFLRGNFAQAASLYQTALQESPDDPALTAGLADTMLRQQKVQEAQALIEKARAAHPGAIALETEWAEVQYRAGTPWLAAKTVESAWRLDPCYPRLHLLQMRLMRLNSMHASALQELRTAHSLDHYDPEIQRSWVDTLPLTQRISELEVFLASGAGVDAEDRRRMQLYLDELKQRLATPPKACRLVSSAANTQIPFAPIMRDATHIRAFGLDVKVNDRGVRLEIDTGASGLLISRSTAQRAGLTEFAKTEMGGIGNQGEKNGYIAFADSIKIGALEFRDCAVHVLDGRSVLNSDGLIGMDVFSNLLVTLDYPVRKLALAPLPQRPEDAAPVKPTLETEENANGDNDDDEEAQSETSRKADPKQSAPARGPRNRYVAPEMKDWFPVYRVGHNLLIRAALNKAIEGLFILDTGSFTTTLSSETARELGKLHTEDRLNIRGISGKVDKVYYAENVTFYFANLSQKADEAVAFDTSNISKHMGLEISGFIGFTTLSQLAIHIDYRDGLVKFDYNPKRGFR